MAAKKNRGEKISVVRDRQRKAAMPEVKALLKKHGRAPVVWCLNQLSEYDKKVERIKQLKKEASDLEHEIS